MSYPFSFHLFNRMPIIGIMRGFSTKQIEAVAQIFYTAGFTNLEITMNSEGAADTIASLCSEYDGKLNIGAGTVCTMADLEQALKAGAQYIVTPIVNEDVIRACAEEKIPVFPGAYTPTEIYKAWFAGATMVKVFPATTLGPGYIGEVLGPLNQLKLIPTGGISSTNFIQYLEKGAAGVGMGSHLFPKKIIENNDREALAAIFAEVKARYAGYADKPEQ